MAEAHNAVLVRRAVEEIWNRGQLDVADVLFATDYINHAGLIPDFVRGPEAIKISVAFYRTAFPNFQISIDALTANRNAVLLRWTAHSSAPPAGRAAGAMPGALTGMIVSRCAGGRIVESWAQWDQAGVLEQLGLLHRAGPPGSVPTYTAHG
jgi:hypothetical protein